MSVTERERLAPSTFRLPVEKIRDGYYSDAYFNHTKALMEADGHHPHVVMQVFQREDSILGGVDEAIAVGTKPAPPSSPILRSSNRPLSTTAGTESRNE